MLRRTQNFDSKGYGRSAFRESKGAPTSSSNQLTSLQKLTVEHYLYSLRFAEFLAVVVRPIFMKKATKMHAKITSG